MSFQINAELQYDALWRSTLLLRIRALVPQNLKLRRESIFEACLKNRWFILHPKRQTALKGLVRIATNCDAEDAAVATIFGPMQMAGMSMSCVADLFQPLCAADLAGRAKLIEP